jgi:hypothetical protein
MKLLLPPNIFLFGRVRVRKLGSILTNLQNIANSKTLKRTQKMYQDQIVSTYYQWTLAAYMTKLFAVCLE